MNRINLYRSAKGKPLGIKVIWLLLAGWALIGCDVDTEGLSRDAERATEFDVLPPMICPGESVTVSWSIPHWDVEPCRFDCSRVDDLSSRPVDLLAYLTRVGYSGSEVVVPPDDTSFDFQATVCDERGCLDPINRSRFVNVMHEREGIVEGVFPGYCNPGPGYASFFLHLSPCSQIMGIVNTSSETIRISRAADFRGLTSDWLNPGEVTYVFNEIVIAPGVELYARPLYPPFPLTVCGNRSTMSLPPPGSLTVNIFLECDPEREGCGGAVSAALISVPCGDGICNADYEDSLSCSEDCGGPETDVIPLDITETVTPLPTEMPISPPTVPMASFTKNTNCRRGPGTAYGVVTSLLEGQEVLLEGRNTDNSWWWALLPQSTAHCWVSDSTVDISGPVAELALIAAPPTPTSTPQPPTPKPSPPAAPTKLTISAKVCNESVYSVTLGWTDNVVNEDGYRVYRDGQLIATMGANTSSYTDNPPGSGPYTYSVEAFNTAGASGRSTVKEEGCLY